MYFPNFSLSKKLTKSLKKNFAIIYKHNAPIEIEIVEIKVPTHFPNNIPDSNNNGDPKPKSIIQIAANIENRERFKIMFLPTNSLIFACINL